MPYSGLPPVYIEPEAVNYIAKNGGHVMIRPSLRHGCCGGTVYLPVVELGQPQWTTRYRRVDCSGVAVHVDTEISSGIGETLTIALDGIWRWKKLWVDGGSSRLE